MEPELHPPRDVPSVKVRIAASAGGLIAGIDAAGASLTYDAETTTGAQRLARRVGEAVTDRLGDTPR